MSHGWWILLAWFLLFFFLPFTAGAWVWSLSHGFNNPPLTLHQIQSHKTTRKQCSRCLQCTTTAPNLMASDKSVWGWKSSRKERGKKAASAGFKVAMRCSSSNLITFLLLSSVLMYWLGFFSCQKHPKMTGCCLNNIILRHSLYIIGNKLSKSDWTSLLFYGFCSILCIDKPTMLSRCTLRSIASFQISDVFFRLDFLRVALASRFTGALPVCKRMFIAASMITQPEGRSHSHSPEVLHRRLA